MLILNLVNYKKILVKIIMNTTIINILENRGININDLTPEQQSLVDTLSYMLSENYPIGLINQSLLTLLDGDTFFKRLAQEELNSNALSATERIRKERILNILQNDNFLDSLMEFEVNGNTYSVFKQRCINILQNQSETTFLELCHEIARLVDRTINN